MINFGRNI